jgi:3-methyladenine DNA glycosylase AlkC
MAKKFKDYYDTECAELLAGKLSEESDRFYFDGFIAYIAANLENRSFSERQELFAVALDRFFDAEYEEIIDIFFRILGPELETPEGMFTFGWWLWPVGKYVERNGLRNFDLSLQFCYELTKRFTGEFAMRPLIAHAPGKTMEVLVNWSKDENVHVRRLASECMRIRLPWAKKSYSAIEHFALFKEVLGNLKNNPEKFVQKSVGNNLNDLMKEKPKLAHEIIDEWENDDPSKATRWIIKHGKRSLK